MRKIYTLLLACMFAVAAVAQDATLMKLPDGCAPGIDGVEDGLWANVDAYNIDQAFSEDAETFTLDLCTWQAVWNDSAIFVIVITEEDNWCPAWCSNEADWQSDKPEIYFDVNATLDDGAGPSGQAAGVPNGHFQYAPGPSETALDTSMAFVSGQLNAGGWYGYVIDDPDEIWEYACLIDSLIDDQSVPVDPYAAPTIGFDVTFIDRDEGDAARKRAVWKNSTAGESWVNMDDCGEVTFSTDEISCGAGILTPQVSNLNVYPSPAMDYLQVEADFNEAVITNIIGQEALILRDVKGTRIDISGLESGLYFISLYNNSKYVGTAKFTIQ